MLRLFAIVYFLLVVQFIHESSELLQEDDVTVIVNNPDVTIGGSSSSSESVEGVDTVGPVNVITPSIDQSNPSQTSGCESSNNLICSRSPDSLCYCATPTQMYWRAAYDFCNANGKYLLSIETQAKSEEIKRILPKLIGSNEIFNEIGFWTSGTLIPEASVFRWASTAHYFGWTNWMSGEPTGMNHPQSCVRAAPTTGYQWGDVDCYQLLPFVCQSP